MYSLEAYIYMPLFIYICIMSFNIEKYKADIFKIKSDDDFTSLTLDAFKYQFENNPVYNEYCNYYNINPNLIKNLEDIPFLPIEFFKSKEVVTGNQSKEIVFESSGTTGADHSKHFVSDTNLYKKNFIDIFSKTYGDLENYTILGLLPSYLERTGSSLVYMVNTLIKLSKSELSGFYLDEYTKLSDTISELEKINKKYILFGVSFALIDFAESFPLNIKNGIIIETGGMKGRREELTKAELHKILCKSFNLSSIHSEYGMTELLSQAYSDGKGVFEMPSQLKILIRDTYDPLSVVRTGSGAINIIDLANIDSCCFIATSDIGTVYQNHTFMIKGRFDNAEIRGCNLLVY